MPGYRFYHTGFNAWYNSEDGFNWYAEKPDKKQDTTPKDRSLKGKPSRDRRQVRENKRSK